MFKKFNLFLLLTVTSISTTYAACEGPCTNKNDSSGFYMENNGTCYCNTE